MSLNTNLSPTLISSAPFQFGKLILRASFSYLSLCNMISTPVYRITAVHIGMDHLRWEMLPRIVGVDQFFYFDFDTWSWSRSVRLNQTFHLPTYLTAIFILDSNAIYLAKMQSKQGHNIQSHLKPCIISCFCCLLARWVISAILYPSVT